MSARLRAVFFDRDGTLTCANPAVQAVRQQRYHDLLGVIPSFDYERMMAFFDEAGYGNFRTLDDEYQFWERYEAAILRAYGYQGDAAAAGRDIVPLWWLKDRQLYPETREVLDAFQQRGFVMGVISDTSLSLSQTLDSVGIRHYFSVILSSDEAGMMKPDPRIYRMALERAGVTAAESLFVDDTPEEADGARAIGMTAFHLDRKQAAVPSRWTIRSLAGMLDYLDKLS